jgi:hypothetical protein
VGPMAQSRMANAMNGAKPRRIFIHSLLGVPVHG